ncbi:hypothetical protein JCM4814A_90410 [Streptomyces phaeofaciens JCM 4814]|uniref:Uncharacterized protein n=1 Tax=Streptomyces phaeofaciens TaxID=68254 RepID=A0A918HED8_9ACTN|nr:hypothetical protein [Streptomyces phaeofaciens]GGT51728.1 hypothetical protein GCM10010226_31120 [Streptomyces phaeofaciens]
MLTLESGQAPDGSKEGGQVPEKHDSTVPHPAWHHHAQCAVHCSYEHARSASEAPRLPRWPQVLRDVTGLAAAVSPIVAALITKGW